MENKKIALVTGANGFIGSHLSVSLVKKGFTVLGLFRSDNIKNEAFIQYVQDKKIICYKGDVSTYDFSKFPKVDYVYHIAGKVSVWGKLQDFQKVNLGGTKNILEYCKRSKPECFTYLSSVAVYGFGYENLTEEAEKNPFNNPYPISKLETETYVKDFCEHENLNYVIIRPGNVYGEYDYTSSHEIFTRIKKEKMLLCANGKYKSCFVYVGNLADAIIITSQNENTRNTDYNVTDGFHETLKEYFTMIAKEFKVKPKFANFPAPLAKLVAIIVERFYKIFHIKKTPLITKFSVYQNCSNYDFCVDKLKATGWKPEVDLEEGIKRTCTWINKLEETNED